MLQSRSKQNFHGLILKIYLATFLLLINRKQWLGLGKTGYVSHRTLRCIYYLSDVYILLRQILIYLYIFSRNAIRNISQLFSDSFILLRKLRLTDYIDNFNISIYKMQQPCSYSFQRTHALGEVKFPNIIAVDEMTLCPVRNEFPTLWESLGYRLFIQVVAELTQVKVFEPHMT